MIATILKPGGLRTQNEEKCRFLFNSFRLHEFVVCSARMLAGPRAVDSFLISFLTRHASHKTLEARHCTTSCRVLSTPSRRYLVGSPFQVCNGKKPQKNTDKNTGDEPTLIKPGWRTYIHITQTPATHSSTWKHLHPKNRQNDDKITKTYRNRPTCFLSRHVNYRNSTSVTQCLVTTQLPWPNVLSI